MDVRMPDGTIVKNVPEGVTKAQLQQKMTQLRMTQPKQYPSMTSDVSGFTPFEDQFKGMAPVEQVSPVTTLPYVHDTPEQLAAKRKAIVPAMALAGAVPSGGTSLLALGGAAGGAGLGAAMGSAIRQKIEKDNVDLADVVGEGSEAAAWTFGGGLAFKTIGALARKVFSPVSREQRDLAKYAVENKLPLPASTQGGKTGVLGQWLEQASIPTRIASINDAKKVNQFINRQTQLISPEAKLIDEVAQSGQNFFKTVFSEAKEEGVGGYKLFMDKMGADTLVPMRNTGAAIREAVANMKKEGIGGPLMTKLSTIVKQGVEDLPLARLDQVRKDIGSIITQRKHNNVFDFGKSVQDAIKQDYDELGAQVGVSARDLVDEAIEKYAKFSGIKKAYPYLERFSKEFGAKGGTIGSKQWFNELFTERNAGALNYIRKEAPQVYQELADTRLAQILKANTKAETAQFGTVLDGGALLKDLEQNKNTLLQIYGTDRFKVLHNFAKYVDEMGTVLKTKKIGGTEMGVRMGGIATGLTYQPVLYLSGEGAAYLLAKGLSNPKSVLFKTFLKRATIGKKIERLGATLRPLAADIGMDQESPQAPPLPQFPTILNGQNSR